MSAEEIRAEIDRVERAIFYEQMADFMDWWKYYKLKAELDDLKRKLAEIEG